MPAATRRREKAPDFEIAAVLEALGADDVPRVRGTGHRKMLCPFHPDTSPSASVSQFGFTCHACGVRGDAIKLLREQEGLDHQSAVRRAEELTGRTGSVSERADGDGNGWWGASLLS